MAATLAFGLWLLVGCGASVLIPVNPIEPNQPNPTGPPPTAQQGGTVTLAPAYAAIGQAQTRQFTATVQGGGTLEWAVNGVVGGSVATGTIDSTGLYTAPATLTLSSNVLVTAAVVSSPTVNFATSVMSLIRPGAITSTANPQVAAYGMSLPEPGTVSVQFGTDTSYGLETWTQPTPGANGGIVNLYVAGMLGQTLYHMRSVVTLADGATYAETDRIFMTGTPPTTSAVTVTKTAGAVPQPGIELFDTLRPYQPAQAFATDLAGNVIWTYTYTGPQDDFVQPIKMLPNGNFLVQISYASSIPVQKNGHVQPGSLDEVREVDLAGNTIRSVTRAQVTAALAAQGYTLNIGSLHHDVLMLPNGHMVLLFSLEESVAVDGSPGLTNVLGDALVDVDANGTPDWVWNAFDHLDVNRHPFLFPDWTHSNALLYSADDHNLVLSVRHQNWLLKIDFEDGKGSGNVLWHLGEGGDFQLIGGTDPTDWFYAEHGPSYFSKNTTGVFTLGVMDNGDDRAFPQGVTCGVAGAAPCLYSTASVLQVDETKKTATLVQHYVPPASMYSFFGGDVILLPNGDIEADFCGDKAGSVVQELTGPGGPEQIVWQASTPGANQYRAERIGSLYPGVQW